MAVKAYLELFRNTLNEHKRCNLVGIWWVLNGKSIGCISKMNVAFGSEKSSRWRCLKLGFYLMSIRRRIFWFQKEVLFCKRLYDPQLSWAMHWKVQHTHRGLPIIWIQLPGHGHLLNSKCTGSRVAKERNLKVCNGEKYEHIKHTIQIESNTAVCERKSAAVLQNVCGLKNIF